ncbi:unnamed protein product [Phytophthora lilii]|uniref:Unnamed protein product n=1 Tax=Phytophthora lilii TaxID=2077276 RepID=A0A9W6WQI5_9STRA|nr:unnamed protein product [Phytophthora lilii]
MPADQASDDALSWYSQVQRKVSLPADSAPQEQQRPRGKSASALPPNAPAIAEAPPRRRGFSLARHQSAPVMSIGKTRRRRKVTFKNMYAPDVVPPPKVESYDELVFNVAGLFHTTSFLHDPEDWGDDPTGSMSSEDEYYDPEPPLERSVPLMIAEFLYRSAMYLGYPQGDTPWLPGFREDKKFSGNDVKRWRRLAHFDWEAEEREFQKNHRRPPVAPQPGLERTESVESNGHTSVMSTIGASFRMRRQDSAVSVESTSSNSSMRSQDSTVSGKAKLRTAVSGWIRKHRRQHSKDDNNAVTEQANEAESAEKTEEKKKRHSKHKPVSWLNPPPISPSKDLDLLVDIINSCVYCGQFQFRKRDIVRLCNIKI